MQRFIPFIVAPVLVAAGVTCVYYAKDASHVGTVHSQVVSSSTVQTAPTPATQTTIDPTATAPTPTATATPITGTTTAPTSTITPLAIPSETPTPTPQLHLSHPQFLLLTFNPQFTKQKISFSISQPAQVWAQIGPQQGGEVVPVRMIDLGWQSAGVVQMEWDGRDDAGNPVPAGAYTYTISATNGTSEKQTETANDLGVTYKRIVVSLSQQRLTAYDDDSTKVLSTLVTTGNPALPTPVGVFPILAKYSPFTFMSSRPPGSKYYYPPAPVTYAMLFDNRGYFIHDAPWRHFFGPGSNAQTGNPGSSYTGSHGCVNVPVVASQKLFKWATVGTVVQVTE